MRVGHNIELEGKKLKQWRWDCPLRKGQKVRYRTSVDSRADDKKAYRKARVIKKYDTYILLEDTGEYKVCIPYTDKILIGWS